MILKNGKSISSIIKGSQVIGKIYKGTLVVYESFKNLIASGVPPLTLLNCKGVDLIDYKLYGNSVQEAENLFNKNDIDKTRYLSVSGNDFSNVELNKYYCTNYIPVTENTTYIKRGIFGNSKGLAYFDADKNKIGEVVSIDVDVPFTTPSGCAYIICNVGTDASPFDKAILQQVAPTPDTPVDIESVGEYDETTDKYKIPVKISGKNLFDYNTQNWSIGLLNPATGNITTTNANYKTTDFLDILDAQKFYIVSFMQNYNVSTSASNRICYYDKNKNFIGCATDNKYTETKRYSYNLDVPSNAVYIRYSIRVTDSDIQIEEGTTATEYEPYYEPITTNIYLNEPLRKGGEYADYIDFENSKVVRKITVKQVLSTMRWTDQFSSMNRAFTTFSDMLSIGYLNANCMSNISIASADGTTNHTCAIYLDRFYFKVGATFNNSLDEFKAYLDNNVVLAYYPLATPTEETIELPNIPTLKGTTILSVDTTIQPSNLEVVYKGKR